jgi:hypothetical protein
MTASSDSQSFFHSDGTRARRISRRGDAARPSAVPASHALPGVALLPPGTPITRRVLRYAIRH